MWQIVGWYTHEVIREFWTKDQMEDWLEDFGEYIPLDGWYVDDQRVYTQRV
jgi:hypothetical protein